MPERAYQYFPVLSRLKEREGRLPVGRRAPDAGHRLGADVRAGTACWWTNCRSVSRRASSRYIMRTLQSIRGELGMTILPGGAECRRSRSEVADYGYIIENGRIVLDGDPQRLYGHRRHPGVLPRLQPRARGACYRDVKQYRRSRRWYG